MILKKKHCLLYRVQAVLLLRSLGFFFNVFSHSIHLICITIKLAERKDESLSIVRDVHYRQAYLYFIYKVISREAPKTNFQGIPLLPGLPVDKKRVRI